jgi:hypothetical protein
MSDSEAWTIDPERLLPEVGAKIEVHEIAQLHDLGLEALPIEPARSVSDVRVSNLGQLSRPAPSDLQPSCGRKAWTEEVCATC